MKLIILVKSLFENRKENIRKTCLTSEVTAGLYTTSKITGLWTINLSGREKLAAKGTVEITTCNNNKKNDFSNREEYPNNKNYRQI